jgi:hypothetical protein
MRVIPACQEGFVSTAERIFQSGKSRAEAREATDAVMDSVLVTVSAETRMPDPPLLARGRMLDAMSAKNCSLE